MNYILVVSMLFLNLSCSVFGERLVKELKYELILRDGNDKKPGNKAFRILTGYIFGDNQSKTKIAMTSPLLMESNEYNKMSENII
jgi:hypothetical protein